MYRGIIPSFGFLEEVANQRSNYSSNQPREGIVVKCGEQRFKMVRQGFQQGCLLSKDKIIRNTVAKGFFHA